MHYGEASFFDGYAFQHIAAWLEHRRLELRKLNDRHKNRRAFK